MNISPRTGKPKLVTADRDTVERFAMFCRILTQYKTKFDVKDVGVKATAAKKAVDELLDAIKLEMLPKDKRPKPQSVTDTAGKAGDAESPAEETTSDDDRDDPAKSPGEGDVNEPA